MNLLKSMTKKRGLSPGAAVHVGEKKADQVRISAMVYDETMLHETTESDYRNLLSLVGGTACSWINVDGLHDVAVIENIGEQFGLHPLTIEDILNTTQRPKLDVLDRYIYFVLKMNHYNIVDKTIAIEQVSFVLGENFLLTFQEQAGDSFEPVRSRLRAGKGRIRKMGVDYLAYALADTIVDSYFTVLEKVGEDIETIEEDLVTSPSGNTIQDIHRLKREMLLLRKTIWPLRELLNNLRREETPLISSSIAIYLNDLYDHTIQIIDTTETYRDMASGMLDIYLSSISNRMNEVMKVLTVFAAIFIPLTFVAGLYGMNFNPTTSPYNMPELNWYYGYPAALCLMAAIGMLLAYYFKKKRWF